MSLFMIVHWQPTLCKYCSSFRYLKSLQVNLHFPLQWSSRKVYFLLLSLQLLYRTALHFGPKDSLQKYNVMLNKKVNLLFMAEVINSILLVLYSCNCHWYFAELKSIFFHSLLFKLIGWRNQLSFFDSLTQNLFSFCN